MKVALRLKADLREAQENTAERERPISEPIAAPTRVIPRTFIPPQAAYLSSITSLKPKPSTYRGQTPDPEGRMTG
jgi:hypothetical protein